MNVFHPSAIILDYHVLGKPEHLVGTLDPAFPGRVAGLRASPTGGRREKFRRSGHGCAAHACAGRSAPWIKGSLLLAGIMLLIVAAARPRFGVYTETVTQRGVDLFVLLDVSRSMTAEDVAPNRLERAKSDVRDLLPHLTGDRVGLIVFAGKPVVKAPLTNDQGFFRTVLDEVDVGSAPRGGTLIGDAIRKALETMPRSRDRDQVLVLITDGEDQDSYAEDAAKEAAERGVKIFTVGLGDAREGARIPVRDGSGQLTYVQYEGQERWSKRNDDLLKKIALTTDGAYIPAGTQAYDLGQVYADHLAGLTRSEYQAEKRKHYGEQFQWFVAFGVLFLLLEMGIASYRTNSALPSRNGQRMGAVAESNGAGQVIDLSRMEEKGGNPPQDKRQVENLSYGSVSLLVAAFLLLPSNASAGSREAANKVRAGISSYHAGDYKQAAEVFSEAESAQPDDLRIAFDHGTALAAQGDDKAVEWLQKAALSPELPLAVAARYNLGCLAAAKAKKRFGEHPEKAPPEVRKEGLADMAVAIGHFRDCLRMDKEHADARHNLELLRVWIKYMESLWEQTDRQKQRDELDLAGFLQMLEEKQRLLRVAAQALAEAGGSPKHREAQRTAETAQRKLSEEIGPLKEKIEATLNKAAQSSSGGSSAPAISADELKKAVASLQTMADEAGMAIDAAAGRLHAGKPSEAVKPQTDVVEKFNLMYRSVAQYPILVGRAVATQQGLVDAGPPPPQGEGLSEGDGKKAPASATGTGPGGKESKNGAGTKPSPPAPLPKREGSKVPAPLPQASEGSMKEAAWNQEFITRYGEILAPLAKQSLEQLQATPALVLPSSPSSTPGSSKAATDAEELQKQREGLKRSMEKAVELGPKVEKLSGEAAQLLRDRKPAEAFPKQQEALKLLKEIAEPLPKQDQKQDQGKQDQDKQDQGKQDQDKQDQNKQDQKQKDKKQQDKPDEKKQQPKPDPKEQEQNERREAAQQQAETQVRQVQERQQKRQDMEKKLQRILIRPGAVDKDW